MWTVSDVVLLDLGLRGGFGVETLEAWLASDPGRIPNPSPIRPAVGHGPFEIWIDSGSPRAEHPPRIPATTSLSYGPGPPLPLASRLLFECMATPNT